MKITVNGKDVTITDKLSISALLIERKLDSTRVAVELNREVIAGDTFATTALQDGDKLEIVQFVGGG